MVNEVENLVSEPEQGESLIAQQVLFGDKIMQPCQRSNLFRICCNCCGKSYNVIVDSGSTDNLVAEEMVQKLGLKRVRHPYPYRIGWLQDDHAMKLWEQCLVDFMIK